MFALHADPTDLRTGLSRRDILHLSLGAGLAGTASSPLSASTAGNRGFGKAKSCILLYLFGGPSHIDIWDMKPDAPAEIRGEFKPIRTNVPGIEITEHLPQLARRVDKCAILRSLTHGDSSHGSASHTMLTGKRPRSLGEVPPHPDDFPHYGAIRERLKPVKGGVVPFVSLPWTISTSTNVVPGQNGGFLGRSLDPFRLEPADDLGKAFDVPLASLPAGVTSQRLESRRALLERVAGTLREEPQAQDLGRIYQRAFDALLSPEFWKAFRLQDEAETVRARYGNNVFGQSTLLARRLSEAGVPMITVYWPDRKEPEAFINNGSKDSVAVPAWDTHGWHVGNTPNFPQLKNHNLPPLDQALTALLDDLSARGTLDETLVVVTGEFGRSPKINADAGRDHYGNVFSALLAGGGVKGGIVHGSSDGQGAYPAECPVSAGDFAATLYHCLGHSPNAEVYDRQARPHFIADGQPVTAIL